MRRLVTMKKWGSPTEKYAVEETNKLRAELREAAKVSSCTLFDGIIGMIVDGREAGKSTLTDGRAG